ncbi:MAG: thioredoxin family protein [Desulfobacteraceae bacterium]|nr:thioredoxin family protein [Desulfobacteraceae bacterium]
MKRSFISLCLLTSLIAFTGCSNAGEKTASGVEVVPGIPVKNTVTLVDLGATTCIPCKMMAPILEELKTQYQGRAQVIFIDVWKKSEQAKHFQVSAIPTQIIYDRQGKEVFRHVGFLEKPALVEQLDKLLAVK